MMSGPRPAPAGPRHQHTWQPNGTVDVDKVYSSPVSTWDDQLYTATYAVQSCACGEVKRTHVGNKNVRTRHEQHQRDKQ